jgi:pyridoxal phosphate enzyme (YggS family)
MDAITARTRALLEEIDRIACRNGRERGAVTLVGVAKTHPAEAVRAAWQGGLRHAGESYLQEALPKIDALAQLGLTWHFVGRIQANKTAAIASRFDWVHSIDRLRVAERLSAQRPAGLAPLQCCIEVKLDAETTKGGVAPAELDALADRVAALPGLRLRGLMALPAPAEGSARRTPFARLAGLLAGLRARHPGMDTLSMGMSDDMEAAIIEGATMVRVGTALFGARVG